MQCSIAATIEREPGCNGLYNSCTAIIVQWLHAIIAQQFPTIIVQQLHRNHCAMDADYHCATVSYNHCAMDADYHCATVSNIFADHLRHYTMYICIIHSIVYFLQLF